MRITILYGTESGNAELAAENIALAIGDRHDVAVCDMSTTEPSEVTATSLLLVICSTHGEGELPGGAVPFAEALDRDKPDLAGLRYAMFGLGDSSYDTYSRGSELISERLSALGAQRIGPYGRHDAAGDEALDDLVMQWAGEVLNGFRPG